ncbi:hypothetical protein LR48_Vigan06g092600 [Vigna angularis]|nr:hypothetical protein LR48_Vigan06g092600 [Vigna angularis]
MEVHKKNVVHEREVRVHGPVAPASNSSTRPKAGEDLHAENGKHRGVSSKGFTGRSLQAAAATMRGNHLFNESTQQSVSGFLGGHLAANLEGSSTRRRENEGAVAHGVKRGERPGRENVASCVGVHGFYTTSEK